MIKKLAKIKEGQGQIAEAADLMQEVAVSVLQPPLVDVFFSIMSFLGTFLSFFPTYVTVMLLSDAGGNFWCNGKNRENSIYS